MQRRGGSVRYAPKAAVQPHDPLSTKRASFRRGAISVYHPIADGPLWTHSEGRLPTHIKRQPSTRSGVRAIVSPLTPVT